MELQQIEELMVAMERNQVKRVSIKKKDFELILEKEGVVCMTALPPQVMQQQQQIPTAAQPAKQEAPKESVGRFITSPIVGTFYAAPSPDDPAYVKVGDQVSDDSVVCIIEAMKVMNEVKANIKGTVVEILVKSGEPVEFGTKIFRVT